MVTIQNALFAAKINDTEQDGERLRIMLDKLEPDDCPAPSVLIIVNPTLIPNAGDVIYWNYEEACIDSEGLSFPYVRLSYLELKQNW